MFSSQTAFQRFADIVRGPEEHISLAEAALVIASEFRSESIVKDYLRWIRETASDFPAGPDLSEVSGFFSDHLGFCGDRDDQGDPRNNLLDHVIEHRRGMPVALSIILLEMASRKDWHLEGVALPGHFMVRDATTGYYIDTYNRAQVLDEAQARRRIMGKIEQSEWKSRWSRASSPKQIIFRLLSNLKLSFLTREQFDRAAAVQEKLLLLTPGRAQEYRDLGVVSASAGDSRMARKFLGEYLERRPNAADADRVRGQLQVLVDEADRLN
ncbi:MAG: SirB1 family protein [Fimbriimonadales bacterium]